MATRIPPPNYKEIREWVYQRDSGICGICHKPVDHAKFHIDHIIPISRGGADTVENMQTAHSYCNQAKGDATPDSPRTSPCKGKSYSLWLDGITFSCTVERETDSLIREIMRVSHRRKGHVIDWLFHEVLPFYLNNHPEPYKFLKTEVVSVLKARKFQQ